MALQGGQFDEPFRRIGVAEAKAMIERGGVQVVDVRQPGEYAAGRVPGAILIPLDALLSRANELSSEAALIFVCAVGERSAVASEIAATVGRSAIYNMEGGMRACMETDGKCWAIPAGRCAIMSPICSIASR
jgi:rhodanese-related sulfurtransferase